MWICSSHLMLGTDLDDPLYGWMGGNMYKVYCDPELTKYKHYKNIGPYDNFTLRDMLKEKQYRNLRKYLLKKNLKICKI